MSNDSATALCGMASTRSSRVITHGWDNSADVPLGKTQLRVLCSMIRTPQNLRSYVGHELRKMVTWYETSLCLAVSLWCNGFAVLLKCGRVGGGIVFPSFSPAYGIWFSEAAVWYGTGLDDCVGKIGMLRSPHLLEISVAHR